MVGDQLGRDGDSDFFRGLRADRETYRGSHTIEFFRVTALLTEIFHDGSRLSFAPDQSYVSSRCQKGSGNCEFIMLVSASDDDDGAVCGDFHMVEAVFKRNAGDLSGF